MGTPPEVDLTKLKEYIELSEKNTHVGGTRDYYELRKKWSCYLRNLLYVMIGFQIILVVAVGFGIVNFEEYKPFLYAVIVENFLQITGMCYIVVNYLFPKNRG